MKPPGGVEQGSGFTVSRLIRSGSGSGSNSGHEPIRSLLKGKWSIPIPIATPTPMEMGNARGQNRGQSSDLGIYVIGQWHWSRIAGCSERRDFDLPVQCIASCGVVIGGNGFTSMIGILRDFCLHWKRRERFSGRVDSPSRANGMILPCRHEKTRDGKNIRGKVLVLHGADDPFVSKENIEAFVSEMNHWNVDWQMVSCSGAVHCFTKPAAGDDPSGGSAYNASADRRSCQHMRLFFEEIFVK